MNGLLNSLKTTTVFSKGRQRGVTTTEYAIMMVLIALAVVSAGGAANIDEAVVGVFSLVQNSILS